MCVNYFRRAKCNVRWLQKYAIPKLNPLTFKALLRKLLRPKLNNCISFKLIAVDYLIHNSIIQPDDVFLEIKYRNMKNLFR